MLTSSPDGDVSASYALDLKSIAAERGLSGDVYNDPAKLLEVCLYVRDKYDHLTDETPAYNALVAAEHAGLRFKDLEERILGRDSHRLAKSVYGELSPSELE
ncbi:MAG: hypothetical protein A07HB70_01500 [uncultured archaeon A07HB70]|nr:MAG: hypothetical protein A07HB70_01500 [uncultured archaeon A07HB70]